MVVERQTVGALVVQHIRIVYLVEAIGLVQEGAGIKDFLTECASDVGAAMQM